MLFGGGRGWFTALLFHSSSHIDHRFHAWIPFIFKENIPCTLCKTSVLELCHLWNCFHLPWVLVKHVLWWVYGLSTYPIHFSLAALSPLFFSSLPEVSIAVLRWDSDCVLDMRSFTTVLPPDADVRSDVLELNYKMT